MADCDYLQSQLTSILNSLVKIAVVELLRVVEDSAVELRLEVSQTKLENEALRIENESNKNKIQSLGAELLTAGNRQCPYCCRVVEYLSPKTDGDASGPSDPFSEDHDASWLQQSEYAHTVDKSTATRNAVKQYLIKKEQQGDMQGKMETQTGISTGEGEQHCPKVDMVFDKEWSQVLWQGGDGFKEDGESSEPEEEDIPGLKDDGDSSGQDEDDPPGPSAIHRQMHITIREGRSLPDLKRCATCCKDFHCPFCRSAVFQPTKLSKVTAHLERHFNRAIFHEGYTIHRCGLNCRPQWHYHCIHCQSMLSRKPDFIKHLAVCKKKHHAKTTTNPAPTSTVADTWAVKLYGLTKSSQAQKGQGSTTSTEKRDLPQVHPKTKSQDRTDVHGGWCTDGRGNNVGGTGKTHQPKHGEVNEDQLRTDCEKHGGPEGRRPAPFAATDLHV